MIITARINLAISFVVALLGLFVWWGTFQIDTDAGNFEEARLLPSVVGSALLLLAGIQLASGTLGLSHDTKSEDIDAIQWQGLAPVAIPIMGMVILYVGLLSGFGYLISTMMIAPLAYLLFGNRGLKRAVILPLLVSIIYYIVFFKLLGMFDPPGSILDISEIF